MEYIKNEAKWEESDMSKDIDGLSKNLDGVIDLIGRIITTYD